MTRLTYTITTISILLILCGSSSALERFPPPEFESDYQQPRTTVPSPRQNIYEYTDVFLLLAALSLASYLVLKNRSRRAIFVLMLFSIAYFGFWRRGCVCSIGAIQNIALSFFDSGYVVPASVIIFFLLPLVFTLFFGRVFCAAVCPLGAIQDIVLLKPVSVPSWLESSLRIFAYVYLASAVMFAATGSAFVICRYDPFISFYRLSGSLNILVLGGCFLIIGLFIGRPYCRFVCPYSVILRQLSRLSRWRVTITPDECIKCRLCEDSCPFGAIEKPSTEFPAEELGRGKKRLGFFIVLLPMLIYACGWAGSAVSDSSSRSHATVRLAERIYAENIGQVQEISDASTAFRATGKSVEQLYDEASSIKEDFVLGGWLAGGFVGLVIGLKLIRHSVWRGGSDYEADRAGCLACGRCFEYCPRERARLNKKERESRKSDEN